MRSWHVLLPALNGAAAAAFVACSGSGAGDGSRDAGAQSTADGGGDLGDGGLPANADAGAEASDAGSDSSSSSGGDGGVPGAVTYDLKFVPGSAYALYATFGGGAPHEVQLDTGSNGLYVPKSVVGSAATISATDTCSVTYVSSGNTLAGHKAVGSVTLLGSTSTGDLASPPSTVSMSFCAVDDASFSGGVMGVGFGRSVSDPTQNVILQMQDITARTMRAGYVLSTHPAPHVQIGINTTGDAGFQTVALTPAPSGNGDWVATSLKGCVSLPDAGAFAPECGGLLVDTGIPETILWGPADPTLGHLVSAGQTTLPAGTAVQIATEAAGVMTFSFVIGSGADSPSAVDVRDAGGFSINTGRAVLVDYDYLFDAVGGLVGFRPM